MTKDEWEKKIDEILEKLKEARKSVEDVSVYYIITNGQPVQVYPEEAKE